MPSSSKTLGLPFRTRGVSLTLVLVVFAPAVVLPIIFTLILQIPEEVRQARLDFAHERLVSFVEQWKFGTIIGKAEGPQWEDDDGKNDRDHNVDNALMKLYEVRISSCCAGTSG